MDATESKIRAWDARMRAAPSFEAVRDVEFVRRSGRINMLTGGLQRELYDRGRFAGVEWLERCKENKTTWISYWDSAVASYESLHGPRDTWFPNELLDSWKTSEIDDEESKLLARLAEIKSIRRAKSTSKVVL
jgi:hypothetical protein